jgi:hypothetical protein
MINNLKEKLLKMKEIKSEQIKIFNEVLEENFDAIKNLFDEKEARVTLNGDSHDSCIYLHFQFIPPEGFTDMGMANYKFKFSEVTWNLLKSDENYVESFDKVKFKEYIEQKLIIFLRFIILYHNVIISQNEFIEKKYEYKFNFDEFFEHKIVIKFKNKEDLRLFINYLIEKYNIEYKLTNILNIYDSFTKQELKNYGLCGSNRKNKIKKFSTIDVTDLEKVNHDRRIFNFDDIEFKDMVYLIATNRI